MYKGVPNFAIRDLQLICFRLTKGKKNWAEQKTLRSDFHAKQMHFTAACHQQHRIMPCTGAFYDGNLGPRSLPLTELIFRNRQNQAMMIQSRTRNINVAHRLRMRMRRAVFAQKMVHAKRFIGTKREYEATNNSREQKKAVDGSKWKRMAHE